LHSHILYVVDPERECPLQELMKYSILEYNSNYGEALAARIFKITFINNKACHWIRLSGSHRYVKSFLKKLKLGDYSIAIENRYGFIGLISLDMTKNCNKCRFIHNNESILVKSHIITKDVKMFELVSAYRDNLKMLEDMGFIVIDKRLPKELNYILTPKQEEALYYAFVNGYFDYPKRIRIKEIAENLGLAQSTVYEALSKAEKKVLEAYIKHNFPHYIALKWKKLLRIDKL